MSSNLKNPKVDLSLNNKRKNVYDDTKNISTSEKGNLRKRITLNFLLSSIWFYILSLVIVLAAYCIFFISNSSTDELPMILVKSKDEKIALQESLYVVDYEYNEKNNHLIGTEDNLPTAKREDYKDNYSLKSAEEIKNLSTNKNLDTARILDFSIVDLLKHEALVFLVDREPSFDLFRKDENINQLTAIKDSNSKIESLPISIINQEESQLDKSKISIKPLKLTVKSNILRANFKLINKSSQKLVFSNKDLVISFQNVDGQIIVKTNEPKIEVKLVNIFEENKNTIFDYYQSYP